MFSVCKQAPLPASQILTASCLDGDHGLDGDHDTEASRVESREKATDRMEQLWPSRVCKQTPLQASQILIVQSFDADASQVESCEKAIELVESP